MAIKRFMFISELLRLLYCVQRYKLQIVPGAASGRQNRQVPMVKLGYKNMQHYGFKIFLKIFQVILL